MRIPSGVTDQVLHFIAVDSTDFQTRETGLTSFTVYRSREGGASTVMTTPTITELSSANMPGVYTLLLDEDMTIGAGNDSEAMVFHITQASMAPVTGEIELYRPKITIGNTLTSSAGGTCSANVIAVSGDTTAADNLELQYDGTGITGDSFPATQQQVGSLSTGSSGLSTIASDFVLTTGTVSSGTVTSTEELDAVNHVIDPSGGTTDFYYEFDIGGDGAASEVMWNGYAQAKNDTVSVFGYDWVSASFKQVGTIDGANGTTVIEEIFTFTTAMTGTTGGDLGKVRLRFESTDANAIATDRVLCTFSIVSRTTGYSNGSVWVNGLIGNTSTESYVDGVADNTVSTLAAGKTIANNLGLGTMTFVGTTFYTLDDDYDQFTFAGAGQFMTVANFELPRRIEAAVILGGTNTTATGNSALVGSAITGALTTSHRITMLDSFILGSGSYTAPDLSLVWRGNDFGAGSFIDVSATTGQQIRLLDSSGEVEIRGLGAGDVLTYSGTGTIVLHSSCVGGSVEICGPINLINNGSGMTIDENTRITRIGITDSVYTTQMTESYAANGVAPSLTEAIFAMHQMLQQFSITGTDITVKQLDNSTTAFVVTLNDSSNPTSAERQ